MRSEFSKANGTLKIVLGTVMLVTLGGCSSVPVDESDYERVELKLEDAREVDAEGLAGKELYAAEKKLRLAREAEVVGDTAKALRLLKEAELHAELAETRSMAVKESRFLEEINTGLRTLEKELQGQ